VWHCGAIDETSFEIDPNVAMSCRKKKKRLANYRKK